MRFFDDSKSIQELDEKRQELNQTILEQYREAKERIREEAPKFKKARLIPIKGMITANDVYGLFGTCNKSPRSPLLVINSKNECNY